MRHRIGLLLRKHARPTHTSESEGEVECILGVQKKSEKLQYLLKWRGFVPQSATCDGLGASRGLCARPDQHLSAVEASPRRGTNDRQRQIAPAGTLSPSPLGRS